MNQKKIGMVQTEPRNPFFIRYFLIPKNKIRYFLEKINYDLLEIREHIEKCSNFLGDKFDDLHIYVMALEDRRFIKHCGIDFKAVIREIFKFVCRKNTEEQVLLICKW